MQHAIFDWIKAIIRKLIFTLSALSPRSSNKALFGSYKERFCDNSKYLYLHWQQTKFIRCIWISGNQDVIKQLQSQNLEVYYRWSMKGIFHALTAKYYFYNSYIGDINQWLANGALKVNLWHGLPMKKIEFDINAGPLAHVFNPKGSLALYKQWLFAHQQRITPDLMLSPSPLIDSLFSSAFRLNSSQLIRATNPRTDYYQLHPSQRKKISESTVQSTGPNAHQLQAVQPSIILYAPSWRDSHKQANPYNSAFDWQRLSAHLVAKNQLFLLRLHPNEASLADELTSYANIINISQFEDVYGFLQDVDLLITDYSSLFIDALPLKTPICFYRFDEAHYQQDCRDMYEYAAKLPDIAPKCTNFEELLEQLAPEAITEQKHKEIKEIESNNEDYRNSDINNYQAVTELFWGQDTPNAFTALEARIGDRS
ncbi:CDP-glycerol glycerophosphotransferase family protein [Shewanella schlegeliana]|uniref:CDP-glycerol glycerophosphotransferase family protein n=1 Tax=Shewanella schlegeliana TaxID=190308 RepID=A0ABS1SSY0_9GAMM|nr:CDP-glycerol glycerophosphotransferase family protein [Shewanella schlegeliana]MBL4911638.1 CDP-glycerol glycerophosphotransferase family protein [Shewanella schlegeliana]MCL1111678.1 CDP-glycerol glycerophosphotransferase family protein [Shewanella schlegeliana]GIU36901.1 teichoic acid biosynthesis protein F [Shewanella schlegeliana]